MTDKPEWKKELERNAQEVCPKCGGHTNQPEGKKKKTHFEYPEFDDTHSA